MYLCGKLVVYLGLVGDSIYQGNKLFLNFLFHQVEITLKGFIFNQSAFLLVVWIYLVFLFEITFSQTWWGH